MKDKSISPVLYGILGAIVGYVAIFIFALLTEGDGALVLSVIYLSAIIFGCAGWIVETIKKQNH